MAKGDDIQERLVDFAVAIIDLTAKLPRISAGRHVARQLLRSGTSPAPNYAEARGAESRRDFIHKLRIVLKELNETYIWLEVIQKSRLLKATKVTLLKAECDELGRIINASIRTSMSRKI